MAPKKQPDEPINVPTTLLDDEFDEMDTADAEFPNWRRPEREDAQDF